LKFFVVQAAQRLLDQTSEAHKSTSFFLSQLTSQCETLEFKVKELAPFVTSEKKQRAYISQLHDSLDQLRTKEKRLVENVERLKNTLASNLQEREALSESSERSKEQIKLLQSKLNEKSRSNTILIRENGESERKLWETRTKISEISSTLNQLREEALLLKDGEKMCSKAARNMEDRLVKSKRSEDALLHLQKASDSENLMLYKQLQDLDGAHRQAQARILLLDAELLSLRNHMEATDKLLLSSQDR
jgi:hypothetical protein